MKFSVNFAKPWPAPSPTRSIATDARLRRTRERSRANAGSTRPSIAVQATYRHRLLDVINEMDRSVTYWLSARFKQTEHNRELLAPKLAMDATAANDLQKALANLKRRWSRRFSDLADDLAAYFAKAVKDKSDGDLRRILKRSGIAVEFKVSKPMREALGAIVNENVSLIRSIPDQYLQQVEGVTMRSVVAGRDLAQLTRDLESIAGVTRRRAELIARDQNNKASSALQRVRYMELRIEKAVWHHSKAGRDKRPSHVANDGNEFDVAIGWFDPDEEQYVWPGMLINCRCFMSPVV